MFSVFLVLMAISIVPTFAQAKRVGDILVFNNWSADAEIGALNVIRKAFQAEGGTWNDITIAHDTGASIPLINMLTGGNPPDVFIENNVTLRRQLLQQGLLYDLTPLYNASGVDKYIATGVKAAMTVDGKILSIPLGVQIVGSLFYNLKVAKQAGVDPKSWKSIDDMFADFPKIRKAGFIPLALGAQKWQLEYLLGALLAQVSGSTYDGIIGLNPTRAAIDTPELRQALAIYRRMQQEADPGSANRNWNDTTALVISGKALMQYHGDWMKGEFVAAKKKLGVDYDAMFLPGADGLVVTVDEETFLKPNNEIKKNTMDLLASIMLRKDITEKFSAIKGASPIRLDATANADKYTQLVLKVLGNPKIGHPVRNITMDPDYAGAFADAADAFWNTPSMTADQFVAQLQKGYDQAFAK
jgi:glucose/mannose transport system substrate-binding protein